MKSRTIFPLKGIKYETVAVSDGFQHMTRNMKPLKLHGCIRIIAGGPFRKQPGIRYEGKWPPIRTREFRLCSTGVSGGAASLQLISGGRGKQDGSRAWFVGDSRRGCRLKSWPIIMYADDLPAGAEGVVDLGAVRRRKKGRR